MDQAVQLFGFMVLTFLGFVVPIVFLLLSFYQEGVKHLKVQEENKNKEIKETIEFENKKSKDVNILNLKNLRNTVDKLEKIERDSNKKIHNLNPKLQLAKLSVSLIISFLFILIYFLVPEVFRLAHRSINNVIIIGIFVPFLYNLYSLWYLFLIIIEVKKSVDDNKNYKQEEIKNLIQNILTKVEELNKKDIIENIKVRVDKKEIDNLQLVLVLNNQKDIPVDITNLSKELIAKQVEVGFVFPQKFSLLVNSGNSPIYTNKDTKETIVRYKRDVIQKNERWEFSSSGLKITPLEEGEYEIRVFIKGDNVRFINKKFKILVVS